MDDLLKELIEERDFVGIGKLRLDFSTVGWNIPALHFLVADCSRTEGKTTFEAMNLEFGLVSTGYSNSEAIEGLIEGICTYVAAVMKEGRGFTEFIEVSRKDFMSEFWCIYREIEFTLARNKQDISHLWDKKIETAVRAAIIDEYANSDSIFSTLKIATPDIKYWSNKAA